MRQAVAQYHLGECNGIIAVGGGSSIDLAKGVAVCATHDGPLQSFAVIEGGLDSHHLGHCTTDCDSDHRRHRQAKSGAAPS